MTLRCSTCSSPITKLSKSGLCRKCSCAKNRHKTEKWEITPQIEVQIRRAYACSSRKELMSNLLHLRRIAPIPSSVIAWHAGRIGLRKNTSQRWMSDETAFVGENAGVLSANQIAKRLGRSTNSVMCVIRRIGMSATVTEGYTLEQAAGVLGVGWKKVDRWVKCKWLEFNRTSKRIPESSMRAFIHKHPDHYDLRLVDQAWFKGVLFPDSFGGHTQGEVRDSLGAIRGSEFQQSLGN